jgi:hypothetical protein
MEGRRVRFTPKGDLVMVRHLRISLRRCSGVGWVRAVSCGNWVLDWDDLLGYGTYDSQAAGVADG